MTKNWFGLLRAHDIKIIDDRGKLIQTLPDAKNLLHLEGEIFLLRALFSGGRVSNVIPENYYVGLDNREHVQSSDKMTDLVDEPTFGGYKRQVVSSSGDFTVVNNEGSVQAVGPILEFGANVGNWGPVRNLFLCDQEGDAGTLICTLRLNQAVYLREGQSITLKPNFALRDGNPTQ